MYVNKLRIFDTQCSITFRFWPTHSFISKSRTVTTPYACVWWESAKYLTCIVGLTKHPFFAENWGENQGCFNSKISAIIYWNQQVGTWSEISGWSKKGFVGKYIGIVKLYLQGYSFKFWLCGEMATNLVEHTTTSITRWKNVCLPPTHKRYEQEYTHNSDT